jgi:hypothetical protein
VRKSTNTPIIAAVIPAVVAIKAPECGPDGSRAGSRRMPVSNASGGIGAPFVGSRRPSRDRQSAPPSAKEWAGRRAALALALKPRIMVSNGESLLASHIGGRACDARCPFTVPKSSCCEVNLQC